MKKFLFLFIVASNFNANAAAQLYHGKCRNTHPLSTYERCAMDTPSGYGAYLCALNEALVDCEKAANIDCVEIAKTLEPKVSLEFVGYKACEARVTVRGWK